MAKAKAKTFTANGNWGELICDVVTGNVVKYKRGVDWEKPGDGYDNIVRLDADEWRATYRDGDISAGHDILDFGSWDKSGLYVGPETDWRFNFWLDRESDNDSEWRIVPRLGDKAKAEFMAWWQKEYIAKCRIEAERQWCYADLPEDHIELTQSAFEERRKPAEFIKWLGEKYDLITP